MDTTFKSMRDKVINPGASELKLLINIFSLKLFTNFSILINLSKSLSRPISDNKYSVFLIQYFKSLLSKVWWDIKHTAVRFRAARSGTSELDTVWIDAPAETKATVALGAAVISSRVADRCRIRRWSSAHSGTRTFSLREASTPFRSVHENVAENINKWVAGNIPLSTCFLFSLIFIRTFILIQ